MQPFFATAFHAYLMIIIGLYKFSDTSAPIDLLVSVIFAVPLLTLNTGVKYGNKPSLYISTLISLLSIIVLSFSFYRAFIKSDITGIFINGLIICTGIIAFVTLLIYFLGQRKKKLIKPVKK